ncbi:MAG: O-methyltransferase [Candidatus Izemoplasma sp.]
MINEYLSNINLKETNPILVSLREYALEFNVPIITIEGINFLNQIIELKTVKNILEIGTAIGYSAINMALHSNCKITTIERDLDIFKIAEVNIKEANCHHQITQVFGDALLIDETTLGEFDLIFIDAAKAQSIKFFEKYEGNLSRNGIVITDNLLFHDLVVAEIKDKNLKQLVRKIDAFNKYVVNKEGYNTYLYNIGDGMSLSIRKK